MPVELHPDVPQDSSSEYALKPLPIPAEVARHLTEPESIYSRAVLPCVLSKCPMSFALDEGHADTRETRGAIHQVYQLPRYRHPYLGET